MKTDKDKIKAIIMDVDGTLTNGQLHIGKEGELFKSFYCRDGLAIIRAREKGITPVILTSRKSEIVNRRAEELGVVHVYQGMSNDKACYLPAIREALGVEAHEVAYIGDDVNDLACMKECGIVACPHDAVDEVKSIANYISSYNGGYGAVRDFIDWLIP